MTSQELFTILLTTTFTTADFHRRIALLRSYLEKKFYAGSAGLAVDDFIKEKETDESDVRFLKALGSDFFVSFTHDNVYSLLDEIEKELKNAPLLILYVPVRFPPEEVEKIGSWCRQNLPGNTVIDLKIDGAAAGGSMFVWNGYLSDYSLRYQLAKHKDEVTKLIGSYGNEPTS